MNDCGTLSFTDWTVHRTGGTKLTSVDQKETSGAHEFVRLLWRHAFRDIRWRTRFGNYLFIVLVVIWCCSVIFIITCVAIVDVFTAVVNSSQLPSYWWQESHRETKAC